MIVTYCDCCKKPIKTFDDKITLSFDKVMLGGRHEYHFHRACATRVKNILDDFLTRQETEVNENA